MRIRLKAPAGLASTGIYGADGKEAAVGTEMTVEELPEGWAGRYDVLGDEDGKEAVINPADGQPINKASDSTDGENPFSGAEKAPQSQMDTGTSSTATASAFVVKETAGGWYVITKGGEDVTKKFRKDDLDGFETMSDDDKSAFVELHKKD